MSDELKYPKFQWSRFVNSKQEQFVIRAETWEELKEAKNFVDLEVTFTDATPTDHELKEPGQATSQAQSNPATKVCPIHKIEMTGRQGKFGYFYSHKTDGGWCNGKSKDY